MECLMEEPGHTEHYTIKSTNFYKNTTRVFLIDVILENVQILALLRKEKHLTILSRPLLNY